MTLRQAGSAAVLCSVIVAAALAPAGRTHVTPAITTAPAPATTSVRTAPADSTTWLRPMVEHGNQASRARGFRTPPSIGACALVLGSACYTPAQIQTAYDVTPLLAAGDDGSSQTICILDSFGSPTITRDVDAFSDAFALPHPRLTIVQPAGRVPRWDGSGDRVGWAGETSLDVEWSHALAPRAAIVLIETPTSETEGIHGFPELARALAWAAAHEPCDVVSQSFGATEPTFASHRQVYALRDAMFLPVVRRDVTLVASSGDEGPTDFTMDQTTLYRHAVDSWPSSDPLVTSVGGTRLQLNSSGRRIAPDYAWGGVAGDDAGGGGLSTLFARPAFQNGVRSVVGNRRGTPDVSLDADPLTGLITYESYVRDPEGPWHVEAGTSAAAPMFAGIVALATQAAGHRLGQLNPLLYGPLYGGHAAAAHGIIDVTHGGNSLLEHVNPSGGLTSIGGYQARRGYDLATGLGTIDAGRLVPALAAAARPRRAAKAAAARPRGRPWPP